MAAIVEIEGIVVPAAVDIAAIVTEIDDIVSVARRKYRAGERTATAILNALDFDFFELLDSVTIARSRKHIETFYDTKDIGKFPQRRKPLSYQCPITHRADVLGLNDIFGIGGQNLIRMGAD